MGLADDLRVFIDSEYENFEGYPTSLSDAASKWGKAFGDAFEAIIQPSAKSGLVGVATGATFKSTLESLLVENPAVTGTPLVLLGPALDTAAAVAATTVADLVPSQVPPVGPLGSNLHFIKQDSSLTALEIAAAAEARFTEWVTSGTYTAWYSPPGSPGVPGQAWGAAPDEPPPPEEEESEEE